MTQQKNDLIQRLVDLLPESEKITTDQASVTWFFNIRDNGGLRLTPEGYRILTNVLDLENWRWTFPEPKKFNKKILLEMDRKISFPFFIERKPSAGIGVVFFSSREASMVTLYGDLEKWLANLESRKG